MFCTSFSQMHYLRFLVDSSTFWIDSKNVIAFNVMECTRKTTSIQCDKNDRISNAACFCCQQQFSVQLRDSTRNFDSGMSSSWVERRLFWNCWCRTKLVPLLQRHRCQSRLFSHWLVHKEPIYGHQKEIFILKNTTSRQKLLKKAIISFINTRTNSPSDRTVVSAQTLVVVDCLLHSYCRCPKYQIRKVKITEIIPNKHIYTK